MCKVGEDEVVVVVVVSDTQLKPEVTLLSRLCVWCGKTAV
jgi:hypothetical protein